MVPDHVTNKKHKNNLHKNRAAKLVNFKDIRALSQRLKAEGKKVIFATGAFDMLNPGHMRYIAEARSMGDVLVVGVATDECVRSEKGSEFPLTKEDLRTEMMSYIRSADYVITTDDKQPHAVLFLLQPDVYFTNQGSWDKGFRDSQEKYIVDSYGGQLYIRQMVLPYFGTEALVRHIADIRVFQIFEGYLKAKVPDVSINTASALKPVDYGKQLPGLENAFDANNTMISVKDLTKLGNKLRKQGKTIAFVAGSYDLLHVGHARFIEQAGLLADVLIVGIPSDRSLRKLKGIGRPIISEHSRAYVLGHLDSVDYVVTFDEDTIFKTLKALKPNVFFTVEEPWNNVKTSPEYRLIKSYGGKIVTAERQSPFVSSSAIIDKLANQRVKEIFGEIMNEEKYQKLLKESSKLVAKA